MEVLKAIEDRRSIRKYENKYLEKSIVEDIINCGRLAPSAKNKQPWFFVVVDGVKKDKIADMMIDYTIKNEMSEIRKNISKYDCSVNPTADIMKKAPILVLVFREKDPNWVVGDNLSIGAAVQNMCLRAVELGIGSLWIRDTVYVQDEIAKLVGYENLEMNCAVSLGYPDEMPKMRPRKTMEEVVNWQLEGNV